MFVLMLLVVVRVLLRHQWVALGLVVLVFTALTSTDLEYPALQVPFNLVIWLLVMVTLLRFGLVGIMAMYLVGIEMPEHALTLDFSTWYAGNSMIVLLVPAALAIFGFWTSLAGRSVFADD
jgi:hypothetical protein